MPDFRYHLSRFASRMTARRMMRLSGAARGIVSITFDDFPASAEIGAEILGRNGARGTFYLCTGRIGKMAPQGQIAGEALIRRLSEAGHEIGCHTRSHLRAVDTTGAAYREDLAADGAELRERFGIAARSFAYPYGSVTPAAKSAATALFRTCRTTMPGINRGAFDATFLRANRLYGTALSDAAATRLQECLVNGGWLIFYLHDVSERPSAHGCHPGVLEDVLRIVGDGGGTILPVGSVGLMPR